MKTMFLIITLFASSFAFAQKGAVKSTATYSSSRDSEIGGNLGFTMGAPNFGAHYAMMNGYHGWGGYFFMQTSKDKDSQTIVNQMISFGGMAKVYLTEKGPFSAYLAPGVGMNLVKDVLDAKTGKKTDKTIFGPMMKLAVQAKLTPSLSLGIERTAISNWFDDEVTPNFEYWSALMTFEL